MFDTLFDSLMVENEKQKNQKNKFNQTIPQFAPNGCTIPEIEDQKL